MGLASDGVGSGRGGATVRVVMCRSGGPLKAGEVRGRGSFACPDLIGMLKGIVTALTNYALTHFPHPPLRSF